MNHTLATLPGRARLLATQVGSGIRDAVPDNALKWVQTGAALGVLRSGSRRATRFVRRHPLTVVAAAAAAGAGLLWYAAQRRARQAEEAGGAPLEGEATRVEARRADGTRSARKRTAPRRGKTAAGS
ncbi:hypothetical protein [Cognatiluteimonas weifangensis]|uniref:Uncharacterized protein n=1 Tax=Cognatiluteimonas weifangensis TaxID=2303539 RepID=A0A372DPD9_9GAMM|nr:hypothetical protein D0Y53_03570 [Luteimonas weifangensis]